MNDIYLYLQEILQGLYESEVIAQDLYEYGSFVLALFVPIVCTVFVLACIYKLLTTIFTGVRE